MRYKLAMLFTVPAALLLSMGILLLGLGGLMSGHGFIRPTHILFEEFRDAAKVARARFLASKRK